MKLYSRFSTLAIWGFLGSTAAFLSAALVLIRFFQKVWSVIASITGGRRLACQRKADHKAGFHCQAGKADVDQVVNQEGGEESYGGIISRDSKPEKGPFEKPGQKIEEGCEAQNTVNRS